MSKRCGEVGDRIARNITKHMVRLGLTYRELADQMNITPTACNSWTLGQYIPSTVNVLKMCEIFETDPNELLGWK